VEATSIDYGIMQQTERAVVLPANDWGWDDVGSWEALGRWMELTPDGNVEVGDCALEDCRDVIAWAEDGRIAALGMRDVVIVRSGGETLVAARDSLDGIKAFVRKIASRRPGPER
jgi:mannose-1-phosphate guanylyltransferase